MYILFAADNVEMTRIILTNTISFDYGITESNSDNLMILLYERKLLFTRDLIASANNRAIYIGISEMISRINKNFLAKNKIKKGYFY